MNSSVNNSAVVNKFNDLVDEFIKKMISTFPNETKLKLWYVHFKTAKSFNSKGPLEYVMPSLVDLGVPIMTKDDSFFQKNEYVEFAESFSEKTGLVNIWESSSTQVKEAIWGYMQSVYVLGMNGINQQDKLREVLTIVSNKN
jgi:hypothetical protein